MSTPDLAPDEKLCPYCAETIKAAAIRCRFCHSDLPAPEAAGGEVTEPTEVAAEDGGVVPELPETRRPVEDTERLVLRPADADDGLRRSLMLVSVLTVLCLVLAGTLAFLVHRANNPELGTAPDGQVTSNSFRNAAMGAASNAVTHVLSYSYKTFDTDRKAARALLRDKVADDYDKTMDQVAVQTASLKLTLKANVLAVGLMSIKEHQAKVLVFVNTVTTREGSKNQQFNQSRLVLDLRRKDGDWSVFQMNPV